MPLAETVGRDGDADADREAPSAIVIISRGLPHVPRSFSSIGEYALGIPDRRQREKSAASPIHWLRPASGLYLADDTRWRQAVKQQERRASWRGKAAHLRDPAAASTRANSKAERAARIKGAGSQG